MRKLDKGSALLITLMILVILSLTGLSFIFLADTENLISNNYYRAMTTLVTAQTGVYAVNAWFNSPSRTADLVPSKDDLIFNSRPYAPAADGSATQWKAAGTVAGIKPFDKPYVGSVNSDTAIHQFFGSEETPDVELRMDNATSRGYLQTLNQNLFGVAYADADAQVPENGGVHITRIALYAPPVGPYPDDPTDVRNQAYAICTALIEAENVNPAGQTVSTRRVRGIVTDINYSVAGEALDVDGNIDINGSVRVHWGNIKSTESIDDNNMNFVADGGPYYVSQTGSVGYCPTLMGTYDAATDTGSQPVLNNDVIGDPWLLVRSRNDMQFSKHGINVVCGGMKWPQPGVPTTRLIPEPANQWGVGQNSANYSCDYYFDTATNTMRIQSYWKCQECTGDAADPHCPGNVCADGVAPAANWTEGDLANYWACDQSVAFATAFRGYNYWKRVVNSIATQGGASAQTAYYLVPGASPEVNGICADGLWGPPGDSSQCKTIEDWTSGKKGFWFFDTTDGTVPKKDRSNIAPGDDLKGKYWAEGFMYVCVQELQNSGGSSGSFTITFPGEPLWESRAPEFRAYFNGRYDGQVEYPAGSGNMVQVDRYINLLYPDFPYDGNMNKVNTYTVDEDYEDPGRNISKGWDQYGPEVTGVDGLFHGIFYLTGDFRATGSRAFWGSVMIWNGQVRTSGTVDVWYDPKLAEGLSNLGLPNSYIEQILTDM
jgi:hypothetical protein